ncbi:hypothetical protein ACWGAN_09520 [Streptomyces sp. NPDC054945]
MTVRPGPTAVRAFAPDLNDLADREQAYRAGLDQAPETVDRLRSARNPAPAAT